MALSSKDLETDALARQGASLTGETLTGAIRTSLQQRLERERLRHGQAADRAAEIEAVLRRVAVLPVLDDRSTDEILGYDGNGLPS